MSEVTAQTPRVDEQAVMAFLNSHPDFFNRHPELLLKLSIPHVQAGASSLLERQIKLQRDKHQNLQSQFIDLLSTAAGNEQLFVQCQGLVLELLRQARFDRERLPELFERLGVSLRQGFALDAAEILLDVAVLPDVAGLRRSTAADRSQALGPELREHAWCGVPSASERTYLFGDAGADLASAASLPLGPGGRLGLLALGSRDPERFRAGMGTLFLDFVGTVLTAALDQAGA